MTNHAIVDKTGAALAVGATVTYPVNPEVLNDATTASGTVTQTFKYHAKQTRIAIQPSGGGQVVSRYNTEVTVTG